ncbi:hypothetical protein D8Y20_07825 [Mariprofundus sp. EBB-1]|uniref:hypothetical protein n=1 Tax=Mariprofundus sp. EBB-1 TaxID=2650971 RepID=UPI000EF1FE9C|nr:hypothetical protein [Mariprofundus sp. EBB-1]RLL52181.1 hypothetical protein D8Y20_07825 [Mariprofundus sp. EBB-1]
MKYVRAIKLAEVTGLTVAAINAMRYQGKLLKDIHWFKRSARTVWYDYPAVMRYVKGDTQ